MKKNTNNSCTVSTLIRHDMRFRVKPCENRHQRDDRGAICQVTIEFTQKLLLARHYPTAAKTCLTLYTSALNPVINLK